MELYIGCHFLFSPNWQSAFWMTYRAPKMTTLRRKNNHGVGTTSTVACVRYVGKEVSSAHFWRQRHNQTRFDCVNPRSPCFSLLALLAARYHGRASSPAWHGTNQRLRQVWSGTRKSLICRIFCLFGGDERLGAYSKQYRRLIGNHFLYPWKNTAFTQNVAWLPLTMTKGR